MAVLRAVIIALMCGIVCWGQDTTPDKTMTTVPTTTTVDPGKCAQDMIDWCQKQNYTMCTGQTMIMTSIFDGEKLIQLSCFTNRVNGTECKKNDDIWFACSSTSNTATFKGQELTPDTNDPETCKAKDLIFRIIGHTKFNREVFEHAMEDFNGQMEALQRFMNMMFGPRFPFRRDYGDDDYEDQGNRRFHYNIGERENAGREFDYNNAEP